MLVGGYAGGIGLLFVWLGCFDGAPFGKLCSNFGVTFWFLDGRKLIVGAGFIQAASALDCGAGLDRFISFGGGLEDTTHRLLQTYQTTNQYLEACMQTNACQPTDVGKSSWYQCCFPATNPMHAFMRAHACSCMFKRNVNMNLYCVNPPVLFRNGFCQRVHNRCQIGVLAQNNFLYTSNVFNIACSPGTCSESGFHLPYASILHDIGLVQTTKANQALRHKLQAAEALVPNLKDHPALHVKIFQCGLEFQN